MINLFINTCQVDFEMVQKNAKQINLKLVNNLIKFPKNPSYFDQNYENAIVFCFYIDILIRNRLYYVYKMKLKW